MSLAADDFIRRVYERNLTLVDATKIQMKCAEFERTLKLAVEFGEQAERNRALEASGELPEGFDVLFPGVKRR